MKNNFSNAENKWKKDVQQSSLRDYSFKSASGDDVDLLYYPDNNDNNYCKTEFPRSVSLYKGDPSEFIQG